MLIRLKHGLVLAGCLQLAACAWMGPAKVPPVHTYSLSSQKSVTALPQVGGKTLLVAATSAAPAYQGTAMMYTLRPYELNNFTRHRWAAPPAQMLTTLLVQNLQASGCLRAVVTPPFVGNADLVLNSQLMSLQQEFTDNTSWVRMSAQFILTSNHTQQLIASRQLDTVVPASANPYAGVVAANEATDRLLQQIRSTVCRATTRE